MKRDFSLSFSFLTIWFGISYPNFMRWKRRVLAGEEPVKKPGPKKTHPLDLAALRKDICQLKHTRKRSFGAGRLIRRYQDRVSRRYIAGLIKIARAQANNKMECRLSWHHPNLAWAIDGSEIKQAHGRVHIQNLQDLCSTYKFIPLTTEFEPGGKSVSKYLSEVFDKHGSPLFLKRDNARNFNCRAVDRLLEERMIIPLNSPCYYAPYNGSIEHAQGEIKSYLKTRNTGSASDLMLQIRIGTHRLNHRPRRSLKGHNACHAYFNGNRQVYNRRKRQQIFDWIKELSIEISTKAGMEKISPSAWRFACQKWMEENGVITVKKWRKVLPDFSLNFYQN